MIIKSTTVNTSTPTTASLFAYAMSSGQPRNMLKYGFLDFVMDIWSSAMLVHILGHSFCIGGAVELLLAGLPPEVVAAICGWISLAFLHWRHMGEILPMSVSKAYKKVHFNNLASIFKQFHISQTIPLALITASDGSEVSSRIVYPLGRLAFCITLHPIDYHLHIVTIHLLHAMPFVHYCSACCICLILSHIIIHRVLRNKFIL